MCISREVGKANKGGEKEVDEAVEQAKRFGQKRAAGFVNAVLRKMASSAGLTPPPLPSRESDPADYARVVESAFELTSHLTEAERKAVFAGTATRVYHLG